MVFELKSLYVEQFFQGQLCQQIKFKCQMSISKKEAEKYAIEKICLLLDTPDSLDNVQELKAQVEKQREIIKNQLKTISSSQIEEAKLAMTLIDKSENHRSKIAHFFKEINSLCKESKHLYDGNYQLIRETIITIRNVRTAKDALENLNSLSKEIEEIDEMFTNESLLVEAHERILKLEKIRDAALKESEEHASYLPIFEKHFASIKDVASRFKDLVFHYLEDFVGLAEDEPATLVSIARIIDAEEQRDAQLLQMYNEELEKISERKTQKSDLLPSVRSSRIGNPKKPELKNYRQQAFKLMSDMIKEKFTDGKLFFF